MALQLCIESDHTTCCRKLKNIGHRTFLMFAIFTCANNIDHSWLLIKETSGRCPEEIKVVFDVVDHVRPKNPEFQCIEQLLLSKT